MSSLVHGTSYSWMFEETIFILLYLFVGFVSFVIGLPTRLSLVEFVDRRIQVDCAVHRCWNRKLISKPG